MNEEIQILWVDALRSGKYEQGKAMLHAEGTNEFCCLGVLCDLHAKVTDTPWTLGSEQLVMAYHDYETSLPPEVVKWAGLGDDDPWIAEIGSTLSCINDSGNSDFAEIAQLIEDHL